MIRCVRRNLAWLACGGLMMAIVSCSAGPSQADPMATARQAGWGQFGDAGAHGGDVVALGAVSGGERNIVIEGTIEEVCRQKGCWMRVTDDGHELFVRFKDYGFFVPRDAAGRRAVMHGVAVAELTSVEELRHYAEDAGRSEAEIARIIEPERRVIFYADSVLIEGAAPTPGAGPASTQPDR